jgi:hydrogenase maturation protein HypF
MTRVRVRVDGVVQGVGFRPYVHRLATGLALGGVVGNDARGVLIEVEGDPRLVAAFLERLRSEAPPLASISRVEHEEVTARGEREFRIAASQPGSAETLVSPDVATCADCLAELADPTDRRYRYPFINCTNCGPRYTIITAVPYDRPYTTMAGFTMCAACAAEYHDPADRRFHAQPVCCPACGPQLRLDTTDADPVIGAAQLLDEGRVVAIKGLGGYHLAVDAANEQAVATLRGRKQREEKPFAVLVADLDQAAALAELDAQEAALLTDPARPIVLVRRRAGGSIAPSVAPGNRWLGLMLPYTPVHHLLSAQLGRPFVLTSGNLSDEPIAYRDEEAFARLHQVADAFLTHDRPIHIRTDDSVVRVTAGRPGPIRRSRGYVPRPVDLPWAFPRPVLACGAELKSTVCLAKGRLAFLSHHIGDLEHYEVYASFVEAIRHLGALFDIAPQAVAHDLHPEYLSTKHALELHGVDLVGVQHHHAHIASCLADNEEAGPVIGVAFDGLGYGTDGTLWGGEFLVTDLSGFRRAGHLATVPMPGGAAAVRQPWRMAAAYLGEAGEHLAVRLRAGAAWQPVVDMARSGLNAPLTSSAGRLFDAVAAVAGVRDEVSYEGQAAIELEQLADSAEQGSYPVRVTGSEPFVVAGADLLNAVVDDLEAGVSGAVVAARFHNAMADAVLAGCRLVRELSGLPAVALSGGVFQNLLLTRAVITRLEADGFRTLTHRRVPCNDGGISLGQAVVAGARDRLSP